MRILESSQNRTTRCKFVVPLLAALLAGTSLGANAENPLRVTGTDAKTRTWTAAQLKTDFAADIKPVEYTARGQKHTSNCVALLAVLKAAGIQTDLKMDPKADPKAKNFNLRLVVVVQGADGYTTTFSLGELLTDIGKRDTWLALDEDGQPLSERDGHMKLIVPGDDKPARWIRDVAAVMVVDPVAPATKPAN